MTMEFKRLEDTAILPPMAENQGDVGRDIPIPESHKVPAFSPYRIKTKLAWEPPEPREDLIPMLEITNRSSTAEKWHLIVQPGRVDSDYIGELQFVVINFTPYPVELPRGAQIAQCILHWVSEAPNEGSIRGQYGFGSTGQFIEPSGAD